jgi:hypothetical protein
LSPSSRIVEDIFALKHSSNFPMLFGRAPIASLVVLVLGLVVGWHPEHAEGQSLAANIRWTAYTDELGTRVEYPDSVFSEAGGAPAVGKGRDFATADGRAHLSIYVQDNPKRQTPAAYLREHFRGSRSSLNYDRVAPHFFAVSTNREATILYRRCNFAGSSIHCIDLSYPRREKRAWDGIVTRISRSLRPLAR